MAKVLKLMLKILLNLCLLCFIPHMGKISTILFLLLANLFAIPVLSDLAVRINVAASLQTFFPAIFIVTVLKDMYLLQLHSSS